MSTHPTITAALITLAAVLTLGATTQAAYIVNGDFEANPATGWTITGSNVDLTRTEDGDGNPTLEVHSGLQAARISGNGQASQVVTLPVDMIGETGTVEFWWVNAEKAERGTWGWLTVYDYVSGARGDELAQWETDISRNWTWTFDTLDFVPTSTEIEIVLDHGRDGNADRGVQFDDIALTNIIPEPASLALLGLGGAAVLAGRRRRRA